MTLTVALAPAVAAARYSYGGHHDRPDRVLDVGGSVIEHHLGLPGNATYTATPAGGVYRHANAHGDTITTTGPSGERVWAGHHGPYGETPEPAGTTTTVPNTSWGWHGHQHRLTDNQIIHMGARPYHPTLGRFLQVDPIEGGCASDYAYGFGDPYTGSDTTGTNWLSDRLSDAWRWTQDSCFGPIALGAAALLAPTPVGLVIGGASLYSSIRALAGARSGGDGGTTLAGSTTTFIGLTLSAASGSSDYARAGGRALGVLGIGVSVWGNMQSGRCKW